MVHALCLSHLSAVTVKEQCEKQGREEETYKTVLAIKRSYGGMSMLYAFISTNVVYCPIQWMLIKWNLKGPGK